jgi:hypothetical protein
MKIQAWENHQKAKTEAEMRKIEVLHILLQNLLLLSAHFNYFCCVLSSSKIQILDKITL